MDRQSRLRTILMAPVLCWFGGGCVMPPESGLVAGIVEGNLPPYVIEGQFEPPNMNWLPPLELLGVPHENLVLQSRQGNPVHAWFLPAETPEGTIFIHHGALTNRGATLSNFLFLRGFGYNLMIYDYQGYGESVNQADLDTVLADADAALDWLLQCDSPGAERIVLYGFSLGTLPAIAQAANAPENVVGLIVEGCFTYESLPMRSYLLIGLLPWTVEVETLYPELDPLAYIDEITIPKLFIQSRNDTITPFTGARQLYLEAPQPKQLTEVRGEHATAWIVDPLYVDILRDFLDSLPGGPPE